ncbi:MAG: hypothetical protein MUC54_06010 [Chloroflexi bacterium]|jgi:hypothetical protein|nr:hypothetical protein [Chloroflexota bacterium]
MGKHHQASRRRSYRVRQHELHERDDRRQRRPADLAEPGDDARPLDDARAGLVRWPVPAWAGLR